MTAQPTGSPGLRLASLPWRLRAAAQRHAMRRPLLAPLLWLVGCACAAILAALALQAAASLGMALQAIALVALCLVLIAIFPAILTAFLLLLDLVWSITGMYRILRAPDHALRTEVMRWGGTEHGPGTGSAG